MALNNYLSVFLDGLKFNEHNLSIVPTLMFLVFAHWLFHRYSQYIIEGQLGWKFGPCIQTMINIGFHLYIYCSWLIVINIFRGITHHLEDIVETPEAKQLVHGLMFIIFTLLGFLPCCVIIHDLTVDAVIRQMIIRLERRYTIPTEMGPAEILVRRPNLEYPTVEYPHAYTIKKSCSAFMLMDMPKNKFIARSKSEVFVGKISKIEDLINDV